MAGETSNPEPQLTGSGTNATPSPSQSGGVVIPHKPTLWQRTGALVIYVLLRVVAATLRYRWTDHSGYFTQPPAPPAIYAIWHNRLALCMTAYLGYARKRSQTSGLAVMVSASKDGGFLSGIFDLFGVKAVRGSSSRRGQQALRELTTWARRGYDLGITPDGPRGPRYVVQNGVIYLAQLTGLPIVPFSYRLGWKIQLKSWDQFQIPLPFSRCEVIYDRPVRVPREATEAEREALRVELECTLKDISRE